MMKYCMIALILAASDFTDLKRGRKRRDVVLYIVCMAFGILGAFYYFREQNTQSFAYTVLALLGIKE